MDRLASAPDRADYDDVRDFLRDWESYWDNMEPTGAAVLARAARLANDAAVAVALQIGRIRDGFNSRDPDAFWTALIDVEFLISSLWKMHLAGKLTQSVQGQDWTPLDEFDRAVPNLKLMRDVIQHVDEYGRDATERRHTHPQTGRKVGRRSLHSQMGISGDSFHWLGGTIDFAQAQDAAATLLAAIRVARDGSASTSP